MTELDDALRESFARLSEPGDPAGVVDSIRTRLDAGDTGTPANSSGFGGGGTPWVLWGAFVVVAALAGGAVGASGLVGRDTQTVVDIGPVALARTTPGYLCPSGPAIGELTRGERVLALSRNDDSSWISVRDPRNLSSTLWVPAGLVVVDADQGPVTDLPLGAPCPTVSLPPLPVEEAPPAPDPGPAPKPKPVPVADTIPPALSGAASASPHVCYNAYEPKTTVVSVNATDNVGVTSVTATVNGSPLAQASHSGNNWGFTFGPYGTTGDRIVVFTAKDAAGNSADTKITVKVLGCVG